MVEIRKAKKSDLEKVMYICSMTAGNLSIRNEVIGKVNGLTYSAYYIEYETEKATVEELKMQNSYFINALYKNAGSS